MTLEEAFIITCHTGYIADASFIDEGNPSPLFIEEAENLLGREVFLEEFMLDDITKELKTASYDKWMEIVENEKH